MRVASQQHRAQISDMCQKTKKAYNHRTPAGRGGVATTTEQKFRRACDLACLGRSRLSGIMEWATGYLELPDGHT